MAIQNRRGAYEDFKPEKLKSGEWATVLSGDPNASDGRANYMCFEPGVVKRMATFEDMRENIELATEEISNAYLEDLTEATERADTSAANADSKAGAADTAAQNAQAVANTVQGKLDKGELRGDKGDTATIKVGTVETGTPGTTAEITNSGTANDAVLNFRIPQGQKGDTGTAENLSDQTVNFTAANDDVDISSGESLRVIFGKTLKSIKTLRTGLSGKADTNHNHSATNITSGTLPLERGGTGVTTAAGIRDSLGISDHVAEEYEDTGWTIRKWASGRMEVEKIISFTTPTWSGSGNLYYCKGTVPGGVPVEFVGTAFSEFSTSSASGAIAFPTIVAFTSSALTINLCRLYGGTDAKKITGLFRATGRWK